MKLIINTLPQQTPKILQQLLQGPSQPSQEEIAQIETWLCQELPNGSPPTLLYAVLGELLRSRQPITENSRDQFLKASELLRTSPNRRSFQAIRSALKKTTASQSMQEIENCIAENRQLREARDLAIVFGADLEPSLLRFSSFLKAVYGMHFVPPIEVLQQTEEKARLNCYTDGKRIFLPEFVNSIASVPKLAGSNRMLNELWYFYLIAHEFGHFGLGSYDLDLTSVEGQSISALMGEGRKLDADRTVQGWLDEATRAAPADQAAAVQEDWRKRTGIPDLVANFKSPRLAMWVLNLLEDGRIERFMFEHLRGLWQVHRTFDQFDFDQNGMPPQLLTATENFVESILGHATGQLTNLHITKTFQAPFKEICSIIDLQFAQSNSTVYDSARSLVAVMDILEATLPQVAVQRLEVAFEMPTIDSIVGIAMRRGVELDRVAKSEALLPGVKIRPLDSNGSGLLYPEWTPGGLIANAVRVVEKSFKFKRSLDVPARLAVEALPRKSNCRVDVPKHRRWSDSGNITADDQLPDYFAAWKSGHELTITYDERARGNRNEIILLIDGSVSMETPRASLKGESSFTRAKQIASWLVRQAKGARASISAHVGIDSGREEVSIYTVPTHDGGAFIERLTPISMGGFRMGALIRHLLHRPRHPQTRRAIFCITDAAPSYMNSRMNRESVLRLQASDCHDCNIRRRCVYEISSPNFATPARRIERAWHCLDYQWADVANAIQSHPRDCLHMFFINDPVEDQLWDTSLAGMWSDGTTAGGLQQGLSRLANFLSST